MENTLANIMAWYNGEDWQPVLDTSLSDALYWWETKDLTEIWKKVPFAFFSPEMHFLRVKPLIRAVQEGNRGFFIDDVRRNFMPDKDEEEVIEATRLAINKGINTLNDLCEPVLQEHAHYFHISRLDRSFDPFEVATQAREDWIQARNGKHKGHYDHERLLRAYTFVRNWGLGHFVLLIDESPEIFNSVHHESLVNQWIWKNIGFENPTRISNDEFAWNTRAGVRVCGTEREPFRHRAKIYDDWGRIRYGSLLMKMFSKGGFIERVRDVYGVELVVSSEENARELLSFFRYKIKSTTALEKYERVEKRFPKFTCHKFILRAPVRVDAEREEPTKREITIIRPLEKYIRLPIEVQIRVREETRHDIYKEDQFMQVFPLWYPRQIYEPLLPQD
ncbi:hypothetical protein HY500_01065 [Candidatus Woesearchaeota archaeon]|nr:hypothetical protein [Candidatus Woesearchaeota archaeon]